MESTPAVGSCSFAREPSSHAGSILHARNSSAISDPRIGWDLWVLPLDPGGKPQPFLRTPFEERNGQFSPDGHWVAYESNESGRSEIYGRPFPGPGGQWQVSTTGGYQTRWRSDGHELYYVALDGKLMAAAITVKGSGPAAIDAAHRSLCF